MKAQTSFIVVGMAGSGKTTFCHRIFSYIATKNKSLNSVSSINLDPAVENTKMPAVIDIRDSVSYTEVMKKYKMGPNGCISTCVSIFLLNFLSKLLSENMEKKYVIVDTPGQIEIFASSPSGEALVGILENPIILYIIDISICKNKRALLSNMLFAAVLKSKFRSRVLLIFNKKDLGDMGEIENWIRDFEAFKNSLSDEESDLNGCILYFEEFYKNLEIVTVSSATGAGFDKIYEMLKI